MSASRPSDRRTSLRGRLVGLIVLAAALLLLREWRSQAPAHPGWFRASRVSQLERLPIEGGDVVMLGASLVQHGEWGEWLPEHSVRNRGVAGDTLADVLARLEPVLAAEPRVVFVMAGLNDLTSGDSVATLEGRQRELVRRFAETAPGTRLVLMSLLPVRREGDAGAQLNAAIDELNAGLARLAADEGCEYLALAQAFRGDDGQLRPEFTRDGTHLTGAGYQRWVELLTGSGWL